MFGKKKKEESIMTSNFDIDNEDMPEYQASQVQVPPIQPAQVQYQPQMVINPNLPQQLRQPIQYQPQMQQVQQVQTANALIIRSEMLENNKFVYVIETNQLLKLGGCILNQ
jgi:hypothetical protein